MDNVRHRKVGDRARVSLLVKTPNQRIDDQMIECDLDWTVARLKEHLSNVYPIKPRRQDQKIIFLGQLLEDSTILKDILQPDYNKEENLFIVHLVCDVNSTLPTEKKNTREMALETRDSAVPIVQPASSASAQSDLFQQYYRQLNNQQIAWMHEAYIHYLTRYTQIMATQGLQIESNQFYTEPPNMNAGTSEIIDSNNATMIVNNNNNVDENEAVQGIGLARGEGLLAGQQQVPGDANNNNNINNPPGNEGAGDAPPNRDWLDIFDMLSKIAVLSSIVYFYSSPSRFLIVTFLGFAIYLIQGGFFRGQPAFLTENNNARNVDNNNQMRQNDALPPGIQIPPPAQQAPLIPSVAPRDQHAPATQTNLNEENERPGAWAFTWTFFSSFFSSLIPDQPNVI